MAKETKKTIKKENTFKKQTIIKSNKYEEYRDLLMVILLDGKEYTHKDIKREIENYLNKEA